MTDAEELRVDERSDPETRDYSPTDLKPTLEWSRHDRTHLEISVDYHLGTAGTPPLEWDAYYFMPETFHLNASTYRKRQVFTDLRSYVRLSVPALEFAEIPEEARRIAVDVPLLDVSAAIDELKLFGSRLQRSIADASLTVESGLEDVRGHTPSIDAFTATAKAISAETRAALDSLATADQLDPEVQQAAQWIAEYLSRSLERAYVRLARHQPAPNGAGTAALAAIAEAQHRQLSASGPVSSAKGSKSDLERVERRQHSLKRFASSVLWLDTEVREANQWAEHVLHAIAAGIAMAFAVLAAILYGNPGENSRLWVWGLLVVVAYMAKDRIKVALQRAFDTVLADRFADRRWMVRHSSHPSLVADVVEKARFVKRDELPPEVDAIRTDAYRDTLQELAAPDSVLHHQKQIRLHPDSIASIDARFEAVTEVSRMDISRWLTHTDDAKRTMTLADPEREKLFTSELPRAYDVIAVYRLCGHPTVNPGWHSARFVVSRSGIRRVGTLAVGDGE